jgi:hypothetical protein
VVAEGSHAAREEGGGDHLAFLCLEVHAAPAEGDGRSKGDSQYGVPINAVFGHLVSSS